MLPYFVLFLSFSWFALQPSAKISIVSATFVFFTLSAFVGLRYFTGGDWWPYLRSLQQTYGVPFDQLLLISKFEPLYSLLNWIGANHFGGLVFVNYVCALIFSFGLLRFCRAQPYPWLALLLAIPYLVIVVAMGYTRQSVAIAFEFLGLIAFQSGKNVKFAFWILIGSLFHRPVLSMLSLWALSKRGFGIRLPKRLNQLFKALLIVVAAYSVYSSNSADFIGYVDGYQGDYSDYSPQGAIIRIGLNVVFAAIFLRYKNYFELTDNAKELWSIVSLLAIVAGIALLIGILPTAVDRLALYLLPLQIFVGSRLPDTKIFSLSRRSWITLLVGFSFLFLVVWMNFAANRQPWLPYNNILFL